MIYLQPASTLLFSFMYLYSGMKIIDPEGKRKRIIEWIQRLSEYNVVLIIAFMIQINYWDFRDEKKFSFGFVSGSKSLAVLCFTTALLSFFILTFMVWNIHKFCQTLSESNRMVNASGHMLDANISLNKWVALVHSLFVIVSGLIPPAESFLATW